MVGVAQFSIFRRVLPYQIYDLRICLTFLWFVFKFLKIKLVNLVCIWVAEYACHNTHIRSYQRTASGSRGSPSTMRVLAIKLRPSAFATEILYAQSHLASPLVGIFWWLVVDRRRWFSGVWSWSWKMPGESLVGIMWKTEEDKTCGPWVTALMKHTKKGIDSGRVKPPCAGFLLPPCSPRLLDDATHIPNIPTPLLPHTNHLWRQPHRLTQKCAC